MTIEQTVEIPASRRLHLDFEVPIEIPVGKAQVELKVIPFVKKPVYSAERAGVSEGSPLYESGKLRLSKQELDEILRNAQTPISDSLTGILADLGNITIEQIREERLAKYLRGYKKR